MAAPGNLGRVKGFRRVFLAPVLTNNSGGYTVDTAISLGAQSSMTYQLEGKTADLDSAMGLENTDTRLTHGTFTIGYGELNLALLDAVMGAKLYADGAGGKNILGILAGTHTLPFMLLGQPELVEGGPVDYYTGLYVCKLEPPIPIADLGDKWQMHNLKGKLLGRAKDKLMVTKAFLSAITDITASVVLADADAVVASGT